MREIKFRAWDKKNKKMVVVWQIDWNDKGEIEYVNRNNDTSNFILMQYTGLKDKNGREIYEGDIVRGAGIKPKIYTVEWLDIYGGFAFLDDEKAIPACEVPVLFCEVIGNIYENPELINENETRKR